MKISIAAAPFAALFVAMVSACSTDELPAETLRPVHTVELRYESARETSRYFGSIQARHEADEAFRVGGKIISRQIEVGQAVQVGDVLAVIDDTDYRLAVEAARQQRDASVARARQAESDWNRMQALELDGSVSASDEEHAHSTLLTTRAAAEADTHKLDLARNQVNYTVLRASRSGVVTMSQAEVGQVIAAGQPVFAIANESEPEIVMDVPEARLQAFKTARFTAWLANEPEKKFEVVLRELSAQAAAQTRTYRARLKPESPRALPLGATAILVTDKSSPERNLRRFPPRRSRRCKAAPRCGPRAGRAIRVSGR